MFAYTTLAALVLQSGSDDGLTFREFLGRLPTDPASVFTTVLLLGAIGLVFWAGRSKGGGGKAA
jgi:hypothetical protein